MTDWETLRSKLVKHEQAHLLQYVDELSDEQANELYRDLNSINYEKVNECFRKCHVNDKVVEKKDEYLEPIDSNAIGSTARDRNKLKGWEKLGFEQIAEGKVACLLMAGGQGTRLGVQYPKGMYSVGLPSDKSLYQLQAERIVKCQQLAQEQCGGNNAVIPWYIMTSEHTKEPTEKFFKEHNYFGLKAKDVMLFEQNTLPCLDFNGKILLDQPYRVARSPDGNGGVYAALHQTGLLDDMEQRGVKYIHVYGVDNILVKMADPVFIGFCVEMGADCAAKVVKKIMPTEPVGLLCKCHGKYEVVEYSEISVGTANKRTTSGDLLFNAGNICMHLFGFDFLKSVCCSHEHELTHHVAKKKIPYMANGVRVKPDSPNGIKLEKFVFDVFQFSKSFAALEVLREDEFSPLKNGPSSDRDCPSTAKASLCDLHYRHILAAGGCFLDDEGTSLPLIPRRTQSVSMGPIECEISPLVSYSGEGLEELCSGKLFHFPLHLTGGNCNNDHSSPEHKKIRVDGSNQ